MSSLWTPDGERPVGPSRPGNVARPRQSAQDDPGGARLDDEEVAADVETMRAELANAPVEVVISNHCYGLFELSAVYLSQAPPLLPQARLAIDALGALVTSLEGRLGDSEQQLKDGLSQLRLAYVQIDGAMRAGDHASTGVAANGAATDPTAPSGPTAGEDSVPGSDFER